MIFYCCCHGQRPSAHCQKCAEEAVQYDDRAALDEQDRTEDEEYHSVYNLYAVGDIGHVAPGRAREDDGDWRADASRDYERDIQHGLARDQHEFRMNERISGRQRFGY